MNRIAVLMGGTSSEREVSLMSGKNVAEALASLGKYDVIPVDVKDDTLGAMPKDVDAAYIALPRSTRSGFPTRARASSHRRSRWTR